MELQNSDLPQKDIYHQSINCDVIVFDESEYRDRSNSCDGIDNSLQQGEASPLLIESQPQVEQTKQNSDDKSSNEADAVHDHIHDNDVHKVNGSVIINLPLKATPAQVAPIKSASNHPTMNMLPNINLNTAPVSEEHENHVRVCRICLNTVSSEESGELENCCGCNGSLKYVHRECLSMSLKNKLKDKLEGLKRSDEECTKSEGSLFELDCELCQQTYRLGMHIDMNLSSWKEFKANLIARKDPFIGSLILIPSGLAALLLLLLVIPSPNCANGYILDGILWFYGIFVLGYGTSLLSKTLYQSAHVEHIKITKLFPDMETYTKYNELHRDQESFIFPPALDQRNLRE